MKENFQLWIVAGCYDGSVHGWFSESFKPLEPNFKELDLKFAYATHEKCIKTLTISAEANKLATGSTDETIKVGIFCLFIV